MSIRKVVAGIDIGGINTVIGLVDSEGNIYSERTLSTGDYKGKFNSFIKDVSSVIEQMRKGIADVELVGIGVGAPSGNYYTGNIVSPSNLDWGDKIEFVKTLKEYFPSTPVVLTNDANAATIGEMIYGGARGMKDFIMVTLGTGVGSGFVANGKMIYGHDSFAGELGHVIVEPNGRQCGCGRKGCLETYASAKGICRTIFELIANAGNSYDGVFKNKRFNEFESKDITKAALEGDKLALEAYEYTGKILGLALANAVTITAPEAIFLFGGLAKSGDLILEPTKKAMEENMLVFWKGNKVKLLLSELQDKNIAVLGAAALAWDELNKA